MYQSRAWYGSDASRHLVCKSKSQVGSDRTTYKEIPCLSSSRMSLPLYPAGLEQSQEEQTWSEPWLLVVALVGLLHSF